MKSEFLGEFRIIPACKTEDILTCRLKKKQMFLKYVEINVPVSNPSPPLKARYWCLTSRALGVNDDDIQGQRHPYETEQDHRLNPTPGSLKNLKTYLKKKKKKK